ncbi:MAG: phosphoribosyltransferase domain-containing protein [Lachnospiraceae bacterium]|nr:phosphoribosyltransferase domain-containing protein [Lachnospiraceae bacterium]
MVYQTDDLVKVAARDNNSKRSYLYVNPLQAKHIPANPYATMNMIGELAGKIENEYGNERLFIIGFAETATAIAAGVAVRLENAVYYQTTTREIQNLENEEFLYFTESHSHATEQKLAISGYLEILNHIDRIVFVEDEVTTGNTIMKLVDQLKIKYDMKFAIASVLNSMSDERIKQLENEEIRCIYLNRIPFEYRIESVNDLEADTEKMIEIRKNHEKRRLPYEESIDIIEMNMGIDFRTITSVKDYRCKLDEFVNKIASGMIDQIASSKKNDNQSILMIGTEECMYPAIRLGEYFLEIRFATNVKTHSTTRSPILVSSREGYPLQTRYEMASLYDSTRRTFLYNLARYDQVWIITDAARVKHQDDFMAGLNDMIKALQMNGNDAIRVVVWKNQ